MNDLKKTTSYVYIDKKLCKVCTQSVKACPTKAVRIKKGKPVYIKEQCIGCGKCIRVCPSGAVRAATCNLSSLKQNRISVALVSPVLYSQFPGILPEDVLRGLKLMGFQHTVDMSFFLEMFQCAAEEFIIRNRVSQKSPWPLISPVCPVVVRLIAFRFPSLIPHILPIRRPVALMSREVNKRITREYGVEKQGIILYYINPCPTKIDSETFFRHEGPYVDKALGINDIYADLLHFLEKSKETGQKPYFRDIFDDYSVSKTSGVWGKSGGEIAGMNTDRTLAISGLQETVNYLEKIEMGMFQDAEYIELRACPEGCLGGALTAIDKYVAKSAVQKMVIKYGLKKRVSRSVILQLFEEGRFFPKKSLSELARMFGAKKAPLSIDNLQEIEMLVNIIDGMDCSACGAPDCRTFAEDVVRGEASPEECLVLRARGGYAE
ncbi:MAG: hypothetical protein GY795_10225 [Desulfobacterales bacterium]|nr:hypothetical protein [Desulfobacterales bacterium]